MTHARATDRATWLKARMELLAQEKEFTRARDRLSEARRALPWIRVETPYVFDGPGGKETLTELFDRRGQLIVYHFMFDPGWQAGCKSCSFWADNFDPVIVHLNQRDVTMVAVSRAPLATLDAFKARMGWSFKWVSSQGSDFNRDFGVSFRSADGAEREITYNYQTRKTAMTELPGISVFAKDESGAVYHTYSCYARGLDMLNTAYHYLDLVPKGRDEEGLAYGMAWVRHRDSYGS